jgi:hypothetical protein
MPRARKIAEQAYDPCVKLSAATVAWSLILSLALWYAYWLAWGEAPTPKETALLAGIAIALVIATVSLRARLRRAAGKKPQ